MSIMRALKETGMPISWTQTLETGLSAIDNDRKRLIEIINLFEDTQAVYDAQLCSPQLLAGIHALLKEYFNREEDLMFKIEYPSTDKHLMAHSTLLSSLEMLTLSYKETRSSDMIIDFITDRITDHLSNEDTSLASFIQHKRYAQAERVRMLATKSQRPMSARQAGLPPRR